jgi:glutathione-specific gamma-glutamylcyclotransferase
VNHPAVGTCGETFHPTESTGSVLAVSNDRWIFGYGSLMWRPGFGFKARVRGDAVGWVRRLWQRSEDHRGVPGAPGLVATLVEEPRGECAGVLYRIIESDWDSVIGALDHRERGGYLREALTVRTASDDGAVRDVSAVAYRADPQGPLYAGELAIEQIARMARDAVGPSGYNAEYVLRLAECLHELDVYDEHIFSVANRVIDTEHDEAELQAMKTPKAFRNPGTPKRRR